jgi:hypothetical protein
VQLGKHFIGLLSLIARGSAAAAAACNLLAFVLLHGMFWVHATFALLATLLTYADNACNIQNA